MCALAVTQTSYSIVREKRLMTTLVADESRYSYNQQNLICISCTLFYISVSQTVVRGPQVVLGFYPCGPFLLNISPKKDRKNKINVNCVSHTIVENLKQRLEITYNKRL